MTWVAGSETGGRIKREPKELLTLFVVPVAYTYTPPDDLQEVEKSVEEQEDKGGVKRYWRREMLMLSDENIIFGTFLRPSGASQVQAHLTDFYAPLFRRQASLFL